MGIETGEEQAGAAPLSNSRRANPASPAGMVVLLQRVLQVYAGRALGARSPPGSGVADAFVADILREDEALWTRLIRQGVTEGGLR